MILYEQVCNRPEFPPWICQGISCSTTTGECQCSPGWKHDGTFIHLANCSEPELFVPILCGLCLVWCVYMQYEIFHRRRILFKSMKNSTSTSITKKSIRLNPAQIVMWGNQIAVLGLMGVSISLWIVGASSIAWVFFVTVTAQAISVSLTMTVVSYARIVYASVGAKFPEKIYMVVFISSIVLLGFPLWFIALPASSYLETDIAYANNLFAVFVVLIPCQLLVIGPILFVASRQLLKEIEVTQINVRGISPRNHQSGGAQQSPPSPSSPKRPGDDVVGAAQVQQQQHNSKITPVQQGGSDASHRMERTLRRIYLFQIGNLLCIIGEVTFCVGAGLLYWLVHLPYMWILTLMFSIMLHASPHVFIIATADKADSATVKSSTASKNKSNTDGSTYNNNNNHEGGTTIRKSKSKDSKEEDSSQVIVSKIT
jgi:hypothetical protein